MESIGTVVTVDSSPLQLSIVAIGFHIFRTIEVNRLLGELLKHPDTYADFEFLAFWQTQYNNMNAVNLFFAWIKVRGSGRCQASSLRALPLDSLELTLPSL